MELPPLGWLTQINLSFRTKSSTIRYWWICWPEHGMHRHQKVFSKVSYSILISCIWQGWLSPSHWDLPHFPSFQRFSPASRKCKSTTNNPLFLFLFHILTTCGQKLTLPFPFFPLSAWECTHVDTHFHMRLYASTQTPVHWLRMHKV